ncbi:L-threonine dehydratase catabolic TdcB [Trichinella pseudospiralis]|uniref:Serine racemase n=1 Tax=Trichinella pseudospiralis TaxID=6337 RepID=A0A0V0XQK4_TRIPS|nr:L-threonine dehydratase catabolic TdcB [Trichinella pseudospiralis]
MDPMCDPDNPVEVLFSEVTKAAYVIKDAVVKTPCLKAVRLSENIGYQIYLKREFMQETGSFKERGARYALSQIPIEKRKNGAIAASAGNHALGLAFHGKNLGIPITVVMPINAPLMKVNLCRSLKANVLLKGEHLGVAKEEALLISQEKGMTYINGYDHPDVIAGQGTIGLEVVEQVGNFDAIVVPVGGGGLISGVALAVKTLRPSVQVVGAIAESCQTFSESMKAGKPTTVTLRPTLADGLAVPTFGCNAFKTVQSLVDRIVSVSETSISVAILQLLETEKLIVEGSGAAGFAALISGLLPELKGKKIVIILSGGNIDTTVLCHSLRRAMALEGRLVRFAISISDRTGGLQKLTTVLASCDAAIRDMHFEKEWVTGDTYCDQAVFVVETHTPEHASQVESTLKYCYPDIIWYQLF